MQWRRRSIRLKGRDYTQPSVYFVTICTWQRELIFGRVVNGRIALNDAGSVVAGEWRRTAKIRPYLRLDAWVIMPNHMHAIVAIRNLADAPTHGQDTSHHDAVTGRRGSPCRGAGRRAPTVAPTVHLHTGTPDPPTTERFGKPVAGSLPTVIRSFKSAVTKGINELRGTPGGRVWQRNYYESVVYTRSELVRIRRYIANNPAKWHRDRQNPRRRDDHDVRSTATHGSRLPRRGDEPIHDL